MGTKSKTEDEWVKIEAVVDSGAVETMAGPAHVNRENRRETKSSREGVTYKAANGGSIKNIGEGDVKGKSSEGMPVELTTQIGDKMSRMLISVSRAGQVGNAVLFNMDMKTIRELAKLDKIEPNLIVNKKTGMKSKVEEKNGLYVYPIWVKKNKSQGGLGTVECDPGAESQWDPIDEAF